MDRPEQIESTVPDYVVTAIREVLGLTTKTGEERRNARWAARRELRRWLGEIGAVPKVGNIAGIAQKESDRG